MKKITSLFNWKLVDVVKVIIGSVLFAYAINVFIVPNNLYTGGVLGIAQLIRSIIIDVFKFNITYDFSGILYYIINVPLFFIAYKYISKQFFIRTVFAVTLQSFLLSVIPIEPLLDDMIVNIMVGGILGGAGIGIVLSSGASTGGSDIIGLAIAKIHNDFSVGKLGMILNGIIYVIAGIMYGVEIMIYSIIYSVCESLMIDKMHEQNICSTAFIFCKKNPKKINNFIKEDLGRDFTYWDAKGGYDDSRTYIIYTALTKYELLRLERYMKTYDDHAFMVKSEGVGIKGEFEKKF
ncbi:MAG: YitT family protein [Bacilli bacterium]|nr:YitT family protein [Bacilli bacterium]